MRVKKVLHRKCVISFNKTFLTAVCLILALMISGGCRPSSVLEQLLYVQDEGNEKAEMMQVDNSRSDREETEDFSPLLDKPDSNDLRDQVKDSAVWGNDPNNEEITAKVQFDPDSTEETETEEVPPVELMPNEDSRITPDEDVLSERDTGANVAQSQDTKQIVDAFGNYITLPANIRRLSAVGEVAGLLYMLGGDERLVATSEDFAENNVIKAIFGEEVTETRTLWPGNGSEELDAEVFEELLELNPEVCVEISGEGTFSREQVARLSEHGIAYVVLPDFNTEENIITAVTVLADILGNQANGNSIDAPALALEYLGFCQNIVTDLGSRVDRFFYNQIDFNNDKYKYGVKLLPESAENSSNGFYSIYINEWEDAVRFRLSSGDRLTLSGQGAAIANSGYSSSPLSYYMSIAGVLNTPAIFQDYNIESKWYVGPLSPTSRILSYSGGYGTEQPTGGILTRITMDAAMRGNVICLGDARFPAVIVPSQYVKERILQDPMWKFYGQVTSSSGLSSDFGFLDEEGNIIRSNIWGEYDIYINPRGIGNWAEGSAESILESVWIASKFGGYYTGDEVYDIVRDFYRIFYRHELSEAELELIMGDSGAE